MDNKKIAHVREILRELGRVVVAYSGGVDSTLLAFLAAEELGPNALAITAVSASLPASELQQAQTIAGRLGFCHVLLNSRELEDPRYLENTHLRCYWCKQSVFGLLKAYALENGFTHVVDGTNFDDQGDVRPGRKAAKELGVRSPLLEAGMTKLDIRDAAKMFGLPNWDAPSKACLSSRIPYGNAISLAMLKQIEQAEAALSKLGIRQARVRHHGTIGRIEVEPEDLPLILSHRLEIVDQLKRAGYSFVALDLEGYSSGSLNRPGAA
jgi:uncharacterized protein